MATVNHVVCANVPGGHWRYIWTLTRALKKAGWKYMGSSTGSSGTKDITKDPENDLWGKGQVTNAGAASGAIIGTPARGRALVTGLTGITSADKGRFLCLLGSSDANNNHYHQIEEYVSSTSVKIDARTFAVTADSSGNVSWAIRDTTYDLATEWTTYGSPRAAKKCWWCATGPSIIKIPFTGQPTPGTNDGYFIRGENITQTSTGFQGEVIGYIWYAPTPVGYLVVNPRVRGTGAGVYGLSAAGASADIVGDVSGCTVPDAVVGTALQFTEEIVIWKWDTLYGSPVYDYSYGKQFGGFFDSVADANTRFSSTTQLTAATVDVAPGSTSFPAHGVLLKGADVTTGVPYSWGSNSSSYALGSGARSAGLAIATDCIEEENWSQDGSWVYAYSSFGSSYGTGCEGGAFQRLDNTEPGEVYPFAYFIPENTDANAVNRVVCQEIPSSGTYNLFASFTTSSENALISATSIVGFKTWRSYSLGAREAFIGLSPGFINSVGYNPSVYALMFYSHYGAYDYATPETMETVPPYGYVRTKEAIWLMVPWSSTNRFRKGTTRWMFAIQNGDRYDLSDDKKFIQLGFGVINPTNQVKYAGLLVGPWDGVSEQGTIYR